MRHRPLVSEHRHSQVNVHTGVTLTAGLKHDALGREPKAKRPRAAAHMCPELCGSGFSLPEASDWNSAPWLCTGDRNAIRIGWADDVKMSCTERGQRQTAEEQLGLGLLLLLR